MTTVLLIILWIIIWVILYKRLLSYRKKFLINELKEKRQSLITIVELSKDEAEVEKAIEDIDKCNKAIQNLEKQKG